MKRSIEEYSKLPDIEKRILQLKSLSRKSISKTDFLKLINTKDVELFLGKKVTNYSINPILDSLVGKKLLTKNLMCNSEILEHVTLEATTGEWREKNKKCFIREGLADVDKLRIGVYFNDIELFREAITGFALNNNIENIIKELKESFESIPMIGDWWSKLLPYLKGYIIASKMYCILNKITLAKQDITIIGDISEEDFIAYDIKFEYIKELFFKFFLLRGELNKLEAIARSMVDNPGKCYAILGIIAFLQDKQEQALENFNISIKLIIKENSRRNISLSGIYGIFHILALLKINDVNSLSNAKQILQYYNTTKARYLKEIRQDWYNKLSETGKYFTIEGELSYLLLGALIRFINLEISKVEVEIGYLLKVNKGNIYNELIAVLVAYWTSYNIEELKENCRKQYTLYKEILPGYAGIILSISRQPESLHYKEVEGDDNPYKVDFTKIVKIKSEWERAIDGLENYFEKEGGKKIQEKRLAWLINIEQYHSKIEPVEQRRQDNGSWSKGKAIALKRLYQGEVEYLTEEDKKAIKAIKPNYYGSYSYYIEEREALIALAGHPLIFDGITGVHVELSKSIPELIVKEIGGNYQIKLSEHSGIGKLRKESEDKYKVSDMPQSALDIEKIIGQELNIPKAAKDRVLTLIQKAASKINVRTELDVLGFDTAPASSNIIVQLVPIDDWTKINIVVKPFGEGYNKPGKGNKSIIIGNKQIVRDFAQEKRNVDELLNNCPTLSKQAHNNYEWKINDPEITLEILYELGNYKRLSNIVIKWPQGKPFDIGKQISFEDLKLEVKGNNQWFDVTGEIEIEEGQVIEMQSLLQMLNKAKGRFIEISDKKFIALTEVFLKRIQELNAGSKINSEGQRVHRLASPLLDEFADKAKSFKGDEFWKKHIERIASSKRYDPKVPTTLEAKLRPYQVEGFNWLSRLSYLGLGGCLADDMGLGKTVQTIAVLLEQAEFGACLVIAPTSVCYMWKEECKKFAPKLNCSNIRGDREEQINALGKMDVLICSYGILYQVGELLIRKEWQTVVLDEAQAIKNFNTQRFKIVTELKAVNRIALTGTPVENHTEELWNLFEFLNPGMLGARQSFQVKYCKAIEQEKSTTVRDTLKKIIQPFVLRRVKEKVLEELPPKTEQTIVIEPNIEERGLYEALRREAIEKIKNLEHMSAVKKRFGILAEITRLRRACCASSLVNDKIVLKNSKLEMLDRIIEELRENKHRALIFSQYVDYLKIVKNRLEQNKISYQYLDGSVVKHLRQKRVEAFQSGEGEVFLISLKAGGIGLNLTAANYVIHLDPWWNPAVEDQASDRAHRMGQKNSVTVYRLVMKDTIEEKIIKMHENKRELALSLLSGSDRSASLNEDELLQWITR
ncbi:DEAD/DEAH box helicase [Candidatus Jidaibacter acanthamoebae]|nr:DEAD/DEAH box helicase [Candidatus Jidaibacter acanthamoeba]